jgi:hypothetical protein
METFVRSLVDKEILEGGDDEIQNTITLKGKKVSLNTAHLSPQLI